MKLTQTFLFATCALGTTFGALAQMTPPPEPPTDAPTNPPTDEPGDRPKRPVPPWLKALDADGDRVISASEIANSPAALRTLDANKDGLLTPDELHPKPPEGDKQRPPRGPKKHRGPGGPNGPDKGHRPPPPIIDALDSDKDGKISSSEIDQASAALKTLDKNNDGQLTQEEIRPPRPPMPPDGAPEDGPEGEMPPPPPAE